MVKTTSIIVLLSAICAQVAFADNYCIGVWNNGGSLFKSLCHSTTQRVCYCLRNTQTATIEGFPGGDIKLFGSSDCKGTYHTIGSEESISNAQWVNSVSFGRSGISSSGPSGCPNYYA
ncbi:hypothetical protein BGZ93_000464 [Podila epicladia]|nr:hypothetical protein BGZ92_008153 [Podila epicladia]KAG0098322.1 hypothetical protein BGZ93_000464 [Podila epicladia]